MQHLGWCPRKQWLYFSCVGSAGMDCAACGIAAKQIFVGFRYCEWCSEVGLNRTDLELSCPSSAGQITDAHDHKQDRGHPRPAHCCLPGATEDGAHAVLSTVHRPFDFVGAS